MNIALGLVVLSLLGTDQPQTHPTYEYRSVGPAPAPGSLNDAQTSYEVKFIEIPALAWRPTLYKKFSRVDHQGISTIWTLDDQTVRELFEACEKEPTAEVIQAPKVTAFDTHHVEFSSRREVAYISDVVRVSKIASENGKGGFRPIRDKLTDKLDLKLEARWVGSAAKLGVVIDSRWVGNPLSIASNDVLEDEKGKTIAVNSSMQLPQVAEASVKGTYDLPAGHRLMVSLGSTVATTNVNTPMVMERMVLIVPRRILLEKEEQRLSPGTASVTPKPVPHVASTAKLPMPPLPSRSLLRAVAPTGQVIDLPALPDTEVQTTSVHTVPAPQASGQSVIASLPQTSASESPQMGQLMRIDPNVAPAKFEPLPVGTSELLRPHSLTITPSVEPQTIRIPLGGNLAIEIKATVKK